MLYQMVSDPWTWVWLTLSVAALIQGFSRG